MLDSLRVLAMQLASVVEIPLLAARMYWEQVAGLGGGARRAAVLSFGKCTVLPGQQAKVVVTSPWRYQPTGLVVGSWSASCFVITEVRVGDDVQPCSTSGGLPCSLFAETPSAFNLAAISATGPFSGQFIIATER